MSKRKKDLLSWTQTIYWYIDLDKSGGVEVLAVMRERERVFFHALHVFIADGV